MCLTQCPPSLRAGPVAAAVRGKQAAPGYDAQVASQAAYALAAAVAGQAGLGKKT